MAKLGQNIDVCGYADPGTVVNHFSHPSLRRLDAPTLQCQMYCPVRNSTCTWSRVVPALQGNYVWGEHKVIMFDEAHAAMIIPCQKVFQSGIINFVQIGNSPTNCFLHQTVQCTPSRW